MQSAIEADTKISFLVVDSDPVSFGDIKHSLLHEFGPDSRVENASSAKCAVSILRKDQFDTILVTAGISGTGMEAFEDNIRRVCSHAGSALIVAITERNSISNSVSMMRAGAHDCVARPIDFASFSTRLSELGHRHGTARALRDEEMDNASADIEEFLSSFRQIHAIADAIISPASKGATAQLQARVMELVAVFERCEDGNIMQRRTEPQFKQIRSNMASQIKPETPVLPMWQQEQDIIERALARFDGNIAQTATALEISPSTIYRKQQAWARLKDNTRLVS